MTKDGGPAFPAGVNHAGWNTSDSLGMSLRDYFAAKASHDDLCFPSTVAELAKFLGITPEEYSREVMRRWPEVIAKSRYMFADAMLKVREE